LKALLDTHTLVWALSEPERLSAKARRTLSTAEVSASVASLWELILKAGKKDVLLDQPVRWWDKHVAGNGIQVLSIRVSHVSALERLPELHRDPFDRILIAQAVAEELAIVSMDSRLAGYGVQVIW